MISVTRRLEFDAGHRIPDHRSQCRNKYRIHAERAGLGPGKHVLEIGSGWGGFALFAAGELGCRVTTITVSKAQHELASARIQEAGLESLARTHADRRKTFDVPTFDRLRVLTTELLRLCEAGSPVRVRLGAAPPLAEDRLRDEIHAAHRRWMLAGQAHDGEAQEGDHSTEPADGGCNVCGEGELAEAGRQDHPGPSLATVWGAAPERGACPLASADERWR